MLNNLLRRATANSTDGGSSTEPGANAPRLDLRYHTALITGSTGQLGRVIARTLADCGASVALHYFEQRDMATQLKQEAEHRGVRAYCVQADITDPEACKRMQAELAASFAEPDIVIGNAVVQYQWTSIINQPVEDYESQFRSSVLQNVMLAKAFVPAMILKHWGRFIAINSECAMQCHPTQSAYIAGKRGMDGLLRVLAREVGEHQITVNQVAPGWMISDAVRAAGTESQEFYEKHVPLRRRGQDQDVANAVAFLASDLASFISGAYLSVSGGNVMPTI
jgi:3-oxoacyl-[acyl-carrier protein] reductase